MTSRCRNLLVVLLIVAASIFGADKTGSPSLATPAELTKPAKSIPFKNVILATTRHHILDLDPNNPAHVALNRKIASAARVAAAKARAEGLFAPRVNEAGNHMEVFVKTALQEAGLQARTPVTAAGEAQTTDYPDLEIPGEPACYLELKTYSAATANMTQRSFYYSPSANPKATRVASVTRL